MFIHVRVRPYAVVVCTAAPCADHAAAVQEPGNRRLDVLQSAEDPTRFLLDEAHASANDATAYKSIRMTRPDARRSPT